MIWASSASLTFCKKLQSTLWKHLKYFLKNLTVHLCPTKHPKASFTCKVYVPAAAVVIELIVEGFDVELLE